MQFVYNFAQLVPNNVAAKKPQLAEQNNSILQSSVLGIEISEPELAQRCVLGNIDPQHTGGRTDVAAIEEALSAELPLVGSTLATLRPDPDSLGAMAVLELRARGHEFGPDELDRIRLIAEADKANTGVWEPRPLSYERVQESLKPENCPLAAIAAAVGDFKVDFTTRIEWMIDFILFGSEPEGYRSSYEEAQLENARAYEAGEIQVETLGQIALVLSQHRAATSVGYATAPVVIALNPEFPDKNAGSIRKFTICQFSAGYADIKSALAELSELEPGWGGNLSIGGSPQGVSSQLTFKDVYNVLKKYVY